MSTTKNRRRYQPIKTGDTFGRLTVKDKAPKQGCMKMWLCVCSCGKERTVRDTNLKSGATQSCGCLQRDLLVGKTKNRAAEYIGKTIHSWTIVDLSPNRTNRGGVYYSCRCICGEERDVPADALLRGISRSCGCSHYRRICKHGHDTSEWGRTPDGTCKACVKDKCLVRNYGITLEEYLVLWEFQGGKCAICGKDLNKSIGVPGYVTDDGKRAGRPEVDHEHGHEVDKKYVRGILCGGRWAGCNRKLGRIDNVKWLMAVIRYLQNPPARECFNTQ